MNRAAFFCAGVAAALGSAFTGGTLTSKLTTIASTTGGAPANIPQGTAPTSPANGDMWTTSGGFYVQIGGSTIAITGSTSGASTSAANTWTAKQTFNVAGEAIDITSSQYLGWNGDLCLQRGGAASLQLGSCTAGNSGGTINLSTVQMTGRIQNSSAKAFIAITAPTVTSGLGTSPTVSAQSTLAFQITAGTGSPSSTVVLGMPSTNINTGWACTGRDITNNAIYFDTSGAASTSSVTLTSYSRTTGTAAAVAASDVLTFNCAAF